MTSSTSACSPLGRSPRLEFMLRQLSVGGWVGARSLNHAQLLYFPLFDESAEYSVCCTEAPSIIVNNQGRQRRTASHKRAQRERTAITNVARREPQRAQRQSSLWQRRRGICQFLADCAARRNRLAESYTSPIPKDIHREVQRLQPRAARSHRFAQCARAFGGEVVHTHIERLERQISVRECLRERQRGLVTKAILRQHE
mmetsp:Transcript_7423/g.22545  ORF Transcript_7423/g.22545 Transcript_7423/m.22545 type:complete len:200 (-) Transcript_7423:869-1468(-)